MDDIKTEGQRQLLEIEGIEDELAAKLGYSRAIVGHWRRGDRLPGLKSRYKLETLFGIPPWTWDLEPGSELPTDPTPKNTGAGPLSQDDDILDIVAEILEGDSHHPAAVVSRSAGDAIWMLDQAAASRLSRS